MSKCLFGCPVAIHVRKEHVVRILLSGENRALLEYYRSVLRDDPDYLRFHGSSTALRFCSVLMLRDFPQLTFADGAEDPGDCYVLEALGEAIKYLDGEEFVLSERKHEQKQWRFS